MEIIIGRDANTGQLKLVANGKEALCGKVGSVPVSIGNQHAKLTITDKGMRLQNLDINNHTFVNGREIQSKIISKEDCIELGITRYQLNWTYVLNVAPADIRPLEQVWDEYERQRLDLQIDERRFNSLRSATGLITMVAIVLSIATGGRSLWYIVLYAVAILISLAITIKAWRNAERVPQRTQELNQQFQHDYVCPHCHRFLGNQSYHLLAQNSNCPYCKTQFIH